MVHAVADCTSAGLAFLSLNDRVQKGLPGDDERWLAFTCQGGTWTPSDEGSTGQDEAAILQRASEL